MGWGWGERGCRSLMSWPEIQRPGGVSSLLGRCLPVRDLQPVPLPQFPQLQHDLHP